MAKTRLDARWLLALAVLALHAWLLWLWPHAVGPRRQAAAPTSASSLAISARLLRVPTPPAAASPPPARAQPRARAAISTPRAQPDPGVARSTAIVMPTPAAAAPEVSAVEPAPLDLRLRLSPETARRGGLTEPAGRMRAQVLNDPRSNHTPDPRQQLPDAVASAAKGDCLKGEYAGWGMGLLSVPFLAYHVAAGNCRPPR
jgi:hypothetical protein